MGLPHHLLPPAAEAATGTAAGASQIAGLLPYVTVCYLYIACVLRVCCALIQKLPQAQQQVQAK